MYRPPYLWGSTVIMCFSSLISVIDGVKRIHYTNLKSFFVTAPGSWRSYFNETICEVSKANVSLDERWTLHTHLNTFPGDGFLPCTGNFMCCESPHTVAEQRAAFVSWFCWFNGVVGSKRRKWLKCLLGALQLRHSPDQMDVFQITVTAKLAAPCELWFCDLRSVPQRRRVCVECVDSVF